MITLATLPQATAQEVFNQVKEHLLKQGKKALANSGCRYKIGNLKCAAGCLISDEEYTYNLEGEPWSPSEELGIPSAHADLILSLQDVHDRFNPDEWESALKDVASEYNLQY